jgi:PST family polysaccharide transporter
MASVGFRAFSALAVGKWIAVCFGPSGTALFGQLMNLYTAFANIPNDGLARAMVKEGSQSHQSGDEQGAAEAVFNGVAVLGILLLAEWLIAVVIALFTNWFEPFQSGGLLFWMLLSFGTLSASYYAGSIFLVWKKTQYQAFSATMLSLGGLAGVIAGFYLGFGVQGCLLGFLVGQTAGGFISFFLNRQAIPLAGLSFVWNQPLARRMLVFTFAIASTGLINQIGIYSLVHWAIDTMGAQKVGLWMAMNRFADAFNTPILAVANSILLPMLAGHAGNIPELRKILQPIFRQSLAALFVGMGLLFWLYPFLLPILFSKEFVAETPWIGWQVFGDFFKSSTYVIAVLMLAMGHTRFYFWLETSSVVLLVGLSFGLYHLFGFEGMFLTHAIRYSIYWFAIIWNYRKIFI